MGHTLWKIDKKNHLLLEKDAAKLTKYLKKADEDCLRFIILAYDYESPFKRYPEKDRIRKAKRVVWNKDEKDGFFPEDQLEKEIVEYRELQYDSRRELVELYKTKITLLQEEILKSDKPGQIKPGQIVKIDGDIQVLMERMKSMENAIYKDDEMVVDPTDRRSLLEKWNLSRAQAKKDRAFEDRKKKTDELSTQD
jgi:hypothetical protein